MASTSSILRSLDAYLLRFPERRDSVAPLQAAVSDGWDVALRTEFRGHVTCGAVVVNAVGHILMVRHRALGLWLLPGGHLEASDGSLMGAAARELAEEIGVSPLAIDVPVIWSDVPIQIDRHVIPHNDAKG